MLSALDKLIEDGRQQGLIDGRQEITSLYAKLFELGRADDVHRSIQDSVFLQKLLDEFAPPAVESADSTH